MKKHVPLGILFGLLLSIAVLSVSVSSVAKSTNFYQSQNDKYDIVSQAEFKSVDQYFKSYDFVIDSFSGKEIKTTQINDTELFSPENLDGFKKQGMIITLLTFAPIVLAALIVVYIIIWTQKQKQAGQEYYKELFLFGLSSFITVFILAIAANVVAVYLPPTSLAPEQTGFSAILFSPEFFADFIKGVSRFFTFLMIIPLFISYLFIKRRNKAHPNDDYLYQ